ncbi:MAG: hypothetical protein LN573_01290 [Rickettsia endosymbiont of Oxypoda opaca]|nr:hypothetical protein [Rickettsia endosymbiont of Oxypoda opaca]
MDIKIFIIDVECLWRFIFFITNLTITILDIIRIRQDKIKVVYEIT